MPLSYGRGSKNLLERTLCLFKIKDKGKSFFRREKGLFLGLPPFLKRTYFSLFPARAQSCVSIHPKNVQKPL
jgi:hypothetical protein